MFAGLWFIHILNTVLFIFSLLKKVILPKRKKIFRKNQWTVKGREQLPYKLWLGGLSMCIGVPLQSFGSWVNCRGGFSETMPEGSPVSDRANATWLQDRSATEDLLWWWQWFWDNVFQKGQNLLGNSMWESTVRICERGRCEYMKNVKEGRLRAPEQRLPCSPWWAPALHGGPWWSRYLEDAVPEQVGYPKEAMTPWDDHAGAGSWQNLWAHREKSPWPSQYSGRTCDPKGALTGASCSWRTAPSGKGLLRTAACGEPFMKDCIPWEWPQAWRLWGARSSRNNAQGVDWNPHSPSSILLTEKKVERSVGKLSLGRKGKAGEEVFRFYLISFYLTVFVNKLN